MNPPNVHLSQSDPVYTFSVYIPYTNGRSAVQFSLFQPVLEVHTYVGEASGAKFERHVEIRRIQDNQLLAKARSVWAALDAHTLRPRRVQSAIRERFQSEIGLR